MNTLNTALIATIVLIFASCSPGNKKQSHVEKGDKVSFVENDAEKMISILVDGELFTVYRWPDNLTKPTLYPVCTSAGTQITRGFPIKPKAGERTDHPHQVGMWLTYGNVNGNDFWGNGSQGLGTRNPNGGVIHHIGVDKMDEGVGEGVLVTSESWADSTGNELLKEHTEYHFIARDSIRIIDRITTLTAGDKDVQMPDTKEGMFGIRVARGLELPDQKEVVLYDDKGNPEKVKGMDNKGVKGNYLSSEGETGLGVWGTRARWMDLYGNIDREDISLVICDHPKNQSYPTWWHARGYGLFSANPLGAKDFTKGEEEVNYSIPAGGSTTFRYRVIISSGHYLATDKIEDYAKEFEEKY